MSRDYFQQFSVNKDYIDDITEGEAIDITDKKQLRWLRKCVIAAQWINDDGDGLDEMEMSWFLDKIQEVLDAMLDSKKRK